MHPLFTQKLAAERVRDLRNEAIASELARLARRSRRERRNLAKATARPGTSLRTRWTAGHASAKHAAARHAG
jgi:hypothetical protein